MTDIEAKALALLNEVAIEREGHPIHETIKRHYAAQEALCRAIEQHEAFKQEVSDAVGDTLFMLETHCDAEALMLASNRLLHFIIPKPKPDPLVDVLIELDLTYGYAEEIRAKLDALGFEIREKDA